MSNGYQLPRLRDIKPRYIGILPDGLWEHDGMICFECRVCGATTEWPCEVADFNLDDPNLLCGGSPRCCP